MKKFYPTMDRKMDPFAANLKAYLVRLIFYKFFIIFKERL